MDLININPNTINNLTLNPEVSYSSISPTDMKDLLNHLQNEIYVSWLKDLDRTIEFKVLNGLLNEMLTKDSIEQFFQNDQSNIQFFLTKFSKEVINNILRQNIIPGENGDELALGALASYNKLFLKFLHNLNYLPLFDNMKEIFDGTRSFYRCPSSYSVSEVKKKKQMTPEYYNVKYLALILNYYNLYIGTFFT